MYLFLRTFGKFLHDLSSKRDVSESIAHAKKLIQTTKISVGTSTTLAMLLMMPHPHTSWTKINPHKNTTTTMSLSEQSSQQLEQSNSTLTNLYTEKIRKAASKAAIDLAVKELVSAKNRLHSSKPKSRFNLYDVAIKSLEANGVQITKAALQKKVSRSINGQIDWAKSLQVQTHHRVQCQAYPLQVVCSLRAIAKPQICCNSRIARDGSNVKARLERCNRWREGDDDNGWGVKVFEAWSGFSKNKNIHVTHWCYNFK